MATKRLRPGSTKWEFRVQNKRLIGKPLYLTFDTEQEGDEYCARLEQLLARGIVPPELVDAKRPREPRLRDWMIEYKDRQAVSLQDEQTLKVLLDVDMKRLPPALALREVTFEWVTGWVTSLKREVNLSPTRVRHYVGALARCLDWVTAQRALPFNPVRLLPKGYATYTKADIVHAVAIGGREKVTTERDRRLLDGEEPEIRRLLDGGKPKGRQRVFELNEQAALVLLFDLALESAMRMSEMYTLDVSQVDFKKKTIFLEKAKNGDKRQIPMTSVSREALKDFIGKRSRGLVFPWWSGSRDPLEMKRCSAMLSRQFDRLFRAACCEDLNFHDLRHEATCRLYERTSLTDVEIARITGHRDPRQLKRYANLRGSDLAERLW